MSETIKAENMTPPDTMIEYPDGSLVAAMFHYAIEGDRYDLIAKEHGFESDFLSLEDDDGEGVEALNQEYLNGAGDVPQRWNPRAPEGWKLAAKYDTEDGPMAMFIRPASPTQGQRE